MLLVSKNVLLFSSFGPHLCLCTFTRVKVCPPKIHVSLASTVHRCTRLASTCICALSMVSLSISTSKLQFSEVLINASAQIYL